MQSVSAAYTTAAGATVRKPMPKFEVQWDGVNWTDESAYLRAFRVSQALEIPGVDLTPLGTTDAGNVTLSNNTFRYSAWHSGGDTAIRTYIDGDWGVTGLRARLSMGFWCDTDSDGDYDEIQYCRIFTGFLYSLTEAPRAGTVSLALRDNAWLLYQRRASTQLYANYRLDTLLYTLAQAGGWDMANDWTADTSPFVIPAAWLDDDAILQEMQQAAAAVAGRLWCDANGDLRYEEASHWLGHSSALWHFDGGDMMDLPPVLNPEGLASSIVVEYSARVTGASRVLYTLDETRTVRPNSTEMLDIRLSQPAAAVFPLSADTDFWFDNGAGLAMNSKITVAVSYYAQRLTISMSNSHATMPAVLRFLQVRGKPIEGGPQEEIETAIEGDQPLSRVRSVRGNFYLQGRAQASYLSKLLAGRYDSLIPIWHLRSAPGVPQLELGDRVGVYDGRAVSAEREGFVLGIDHGYTVPSAGQPATEPIYKQDIRVMDATPLFPSGTYFVIGSTALGSGVAWY